MNERIKELIEQATDTWYIGHGMHERSAVDGKKLAELIVRDVVDTVKRTQVTSPDFEWAILNNYGLELNDERTN